MTRLLHISASPRGEASFSRRVANDLIAAFAAASPGLAVIHRDLAGEPLPHPDSAFVAASLMPAAGRSEREHKALALSETLIAEIESAGIVVISAPLYNFTAPPALKAWIDHIVRPGRTFRSTVAGKQGLLPDRPVFAIIACGGPFGHAPSAQTDFFTPWLRYVLEAIGLQSLETIRLEELGRGPEKVSLALRSSEQWIAAAVSRT